jgi:hypothetical protein
MKDDAVKLLAMPKRDSPFPGMDPHLRGRWSDIHVKLLAFLGEAMQELLPDDLAARAEERVLLEDATGTPTGQWYRPDAAVVEVRSLPAAGQPAAAAGAEEEGTTVVTVDFVAEPEVDRWLQIVDTTSGSQEVTAIEIVSPTNKQPGPLNRAYRRKLHDYARAGVNVVEVDLLRGSRARMPVRRTDLPAGQRTPYLIAVRRASAPERWVCYPVSLRRPIPPVRVPLRPGDADVTMDLQPLLRRAYRAAGHFDIDYTRDPDAPLSPHDAAWADELLRAAGRR